MAIKLDTEKKLHLGPTAVREGTVVDEIRQAVRDLDKGEGVTYADLEKHMVDNWSPKKSQGYGPSYIKAYVRDAVNKYGHLSYEAQGHEYSAIATPEKKAVEPKAKKLTKAQQNEIDMLKLIQSKGEITDVSNLDDSQVTTQDFVTETGKKLKTVENSLAKLETAGLVRTEQRDGNEEGTTTTYVFLTASGFAHIGANDPAAASSGQPTSASGSDGGEL